MRQVFQELSNGRVGVETVPAPVPAPGQALIETRVSLISSGTERSMVEFGKAGWVERALSQPDKVRLVLDKVRTDGLAAAYDAVRARLDQPLAPGYCNVGVVRALGAGATGLTVGDRVVSNARHAELVVSPDFMCARVPASVDDETAAFAVLGAVALQGIRLAAPKQGDVVAVIGLGIVGLLAVQLLRARGCAVLGIDLDPMRLALARGYGAEVVDLRRGDDPVAVAHRLTGGKGLASAVIAAATRSDEPVSLGARMCGRHGRVVLVGVSGLRLSRAEFYDKEISFQVSCSYGPRQAVADAEGGWTARDNFTEVLAHMAAGRVTTGALISHRFALERAPEAYALLGSKKPSLGIVLSYVSAAVEASTVVELARNPPRTTLGAGAPRVGFIGAGSHASRELVPAFAAAGAVLQVISSAGGANAAHLARKHGFARVASEADAIMADPELDAVVIATRHDSHARLVLQALAAGKAVFCEKPLALANADIDAIGSALVRDPKARLMVGFNRRFAPLVQQLSEQLGPAPGAATRFVMTVNAGALDPAHWTLDPAQGGGRIVGEACHFIDLLRHLAGVPIAAHAATGGAGGATLELGFASGARGTIHYLTVGHRGFPKERLEVFADGRVFQLDNFRVLRLWGGPGAGRRALWRQDKGHRACVGAFVRSLASGSPMPIPMAELLEVGRASIALERAVQEAGGC